MDLIVDNFHAFSDWISTFFTRQFHKLSQISLNWTYHWPPDFTYLTISLPSLPSWSSLWNFSVNRPWTSLLLAGSGAVISSEVFYYFYRQWMDNNSPQGSRKLKSKVKGQHAPGFSTPAEYHLEKRKPQRVWNTVIFFPDPSPLAKESPTHQLIHYLEQAQTSIHLAVYLVSHPWITDIVTKKHKQGLLVQVVTDYDTYTAHNNFGAKAWRRLGIEVRMKATGFLMHHKFAVIDEEAVVTGSLNWTKQGAAWNQENVLVSTNPQIVKKYLDEFYTLWTLYYSESN